jgi:hypothetical protein
MTQTQGPEFHTAQTANFADDELHLVIDGQTRALCGQPVMSAFATGGRADCIGCVARATAGALSAR